MLTGAGSSIFSKTTMLITWKQANYLLTESKSRMTAGSLSRSFLALFAACSLASAPAKAELTQSQLEQALQDVLPEVLDPYLRYNDRYMLEYYRASFSNGLYPNQTNQIQQLKQLNETSTDISVDVSSIEGKIHNSLFSPDAILVTDEDAQKVLESISSDASLIRGISSQMSDSWTDTFDLNQGQLITDGNDSQKGPAVRVRDYMLDQTLQALFAELEDFLLLQNSGLSESINQGTSNIVYTAGQTTPEHEEPDNASYDSEKAEAEQAGRDDYERYANEAIAEGEKQENQLEFLSDLGSVDGDVTSATATFDNGSSLSSLQVEDVPIVIMGERVTSHLTSHRLDPLILERSQLWQADGMAAHVKPWVDAVWMLITALAIGTLARQEWNHYMHAPTLADSILFPR